MTLHSRMPSYPYVDILTHWVEHVSGADLQGYTRHCVKGEDYPAIVDRRGTDTIMNNQYVSLWTWLTERLKEEEYTTRGTFVSGLTIMDVRALDIFEGDVRSPPLLKLG